MILTSRMIGFRWAKVIPICKHAIIPFRFFSVLSCCICNPDPCRRFGSFQSYLQPHDPDNLSPECVANPRFTTLLRTPHLLSSMDRRPLYCRTQVTVSPRDVQYFKWSLGVVPVAFLNNTRFMNRPITIARASTGRLIKFKCSRAIEGKKIFKARPKI